MESPLSFFRMHWDREPDWHPSPCPLPALRGEGGRRPGEGRFMESLAPQSCAVAEFRNCLTIVPTLTIFAACQISSCVLS